MAGAVLAKKTKVEVKIGSAWVAMKGLLSISGIGGGSASIIDVTDLDSEAKEKAMGLADEGSVKIDCHMLADDAAQDRLIEARADQSEVEIKITLPNKKVYELDTFCSTAEPGGIGVDSKVTISFGLEITGPARRSEVTA